MKIKYIWKHNGNDSLLYFGNIIGAYTGGVSKNYTWIKNNNCHQNLAVTLRKYLNVTAFVFQQITISNARFLPVSYSQPPSWKLL